MVAKTMASYIARARQKRQSQQGPSVHVKVRKDQVANASGAQVFSAGPWEQLTRFLILGSEGGSYYAGEKKLTVDNAKNVEACIKEDGVSVVDTIVEISKAGRAYSNSPALLALALCTTGSDPETRGYAMAMMPEVARTGTHLFEFVEYANSIRGWGRLLREGVANWYNRLDTDKLAYQLIKYQQREGWSHRDAIRLSHPNPANDTVRNNLYKYVVKGAEKISYGDPMPGIVIAFEKAKTASTKELVKLITDYNLPREAVPTEKLNEIAVWEALMENMPVTAMIRNLGKMTSIGLLKAGSEGTLKVVNTLTDASILKKARVHPYNILVALDTYSQGHGMKGKLTWPVIQQVVASLDESFYQAFGWIEPSGRRTCMALDLSGSMHGWAGMANGNCIAGTKITPAQASLAMAMVTMRTEKKSDWKLMGFGHTFMELGLKVNTKLQDAVKAIKTANFGSTDCSLPFRWALQNRLPFDTFVVYTDNETNTGTHPFQAMKQYRDQMGIDAKLVVVGMTATKFTIADPKDKGMLDVVGFDTAAPQVIADFSANRF